VNQESSGENHGHSNQDRSGKDIYQLYIDDSGDRKLGSPPSPHLPFGMDYFALGGIIINSNQVPRINEMHRSLCNEFNINYPLHSTQLRGKKDNFRWLRTNQEACSRFFVRLEEMISAIPMVTIATVIHRPGYMSRYKDKYPGDLWKYCKTAYCILVERAVKVVKNLDGKLEVFFEQCGKVEDAAVYTYNQMLKTSGMPFEPGSSASYYSLQPSDFQNVLLGDPKRGTKDVPMLQLADLVLYPMIRGGYQKDYAPYLNLIETNKLIDVWLSETDRATCGVKYSCFDSPKTTNPTEVGLEAARVGRPRGQAHGRQPT